MEDTGNDELMASLIVLATVVTMLRAPLPWVVDFINSRVSLEAAGTTAKDIVSSPAAATGIAESELGSFDIVLVDVQQDPSGEYGKL